MSSNIIPLRCFAYFNEKDNRYYAFCVDLNLADQGSSFENVANKLLDNIKLYLETELEYNKKNGISEFPYRRSPLSVLFNYYSISLLFHMKFLVSGLLNKYKWYKGFFNKDNHSIKLFPA